MGIEMVPSDVGKIDDVGIGYGTLMRFDRHAWLNLFKLITEWMQRTLFVGSIRLVDSSNVRDCRG